MMQTIRIRPRSSRRDPTTCSVQFCSGRAWTWRCISRPTYQVAISCKAKVAGSIQSTRRNPACAYPTAQLPEINAYATAHCGYLQDMFRKASTSPKAANRQNTPPISTAFDLRGTVCQYLAFSFHEKRLRIPSVRPVSKFVRMTLELLQQIAQQHLRGATSLRSYNTRPYAAPGKPALRHLSL